MLDSFDALVERVLGVVRRRPARAAWASTGPVSTPASTTCTVQPVSAAPAASASRTAWAPGNAGSSAGWVLRTVQPAEDRGPEQLHEPGRHDEGRARGRRSARPAPRPTRRGCRGPRPGTRRWGCPRHRRGADRRCRPGRAPTARMRTPYAGSAVGVDQGLEVGARPGDQDDDPGRLRRSHGRRRYRAPRQAAAPASVPRSTRVLRFAAVLAAQDPAIAEAVRQVSGGASSGPRPAPAPAPTPSSTSRARVSHPGRGADVGQPLHAERRAGQDVEQAEWHPRPPRRPTPATVSLVRAVDSRATARSERQPTNGADRHGQQDEQRQVAGEGARLGQRAEARDHRQQRRAAAGPGRRGALDRGEPGAGDERHRPEGEVGQHEQLGERQDHAAHDARARARPAGG